MVAEFDEAELDMFGMGILDRLREEGGLASGVGILLFTSAWCLVSGE